MVTSVKIPKCLKVRHPQIPLCRYILFSTLSPNSDMAKKESGITMSKSDWGKSKRRIICDSSSIEMMVQGRNIVTSNQRSVPSNRQKYVLTEAGRQLIKDCAFK